jgi:hypothetical protein
MIVKAPPGRRSAISFVTNSSLRDGDPEEYAGFAESIARSGYAKCVAYLGASRKLGTCRSAPDHSRRFRAVRSMCRRL